MAVYTFTRPGCDRVYTITYDLGPTRVEDTGRTGGLYEIADDLGARVADEDQRAWGCVILEAQVA